MSQLPKVTAKPKFGVIEIKIEIGSGVFIFDASISEAEDIIRAMVRSVDTARGLRS